MSAPENVEPLLTVQDVARRLNVPVSWVYAHAESKELPSLKIGRYRRFRVVDLDEYLAAQRQESEAK